MKKNLYLGKFIYKKDDTGIINALKRNRLIYFYTIKTLNSDLNRKCKIVYIGKSTINKRENNHVEIQHWLTSFISDKKNIKRLSEINAQNSFSIYILEVRDNIDDITHKNIEQAVIKIFMENHNGKKPILNIKEPSKKEINVLLQNSEFTQKDLERIIEEIETDRADMN